VYVGVLPPGDYSEVRVAHPPRGSKKVLSNTRETTEAGQVAFLGHVEGSESQPLGHLKQLYGDRLRIAVASGVLRVTLAGPHARVCPDWFVTVYMTDTPAVFNVIPNGLHSFTVNCPR
jgi:hypothetical protein